MYSTLNMINLKPLVIYFNGIVQIIGYFMESIRQRLLEKKKIMYIASVVYGSRVFCFYKFIRVADEITSFD